MCIRWSFTSSAPAKHAVKSFPAASEDGFSELLMSSSQTQPESKHWAAINDPAPTPLHGCALARRRPSNRRGALLWLGRARALRGVAGRPGGCWTAQASAILAGWAVTFFEGSKIIVAVGRCRTYVIGVGTVSLTEPPTNEDEMEKAIAITERNVYGNIAYYPACDMSRLLCEIA